MFYVQARINCKLHGSVCYTATGYHTRYWWAILFYLLAYLHIKNFNTGKISCMTLHA